jgi:predicted RNase H-like HicB family nuclease
MERNLKLRLAFAFSLCILPVMKATFTYWKESDGKYLGYLNSHPDHWTQGEDLEDLKSDLRDLHEMFSAEEIPGIRKVSALEVA